ncbi:MAG: 23S rRNA (pseudouridine(1915)-N(3))-methyltransferase RlmH, partial [bacterium]
MKIKILTVGKTKQPHWQMAETDYLRRIQRYATLEFVSIKDASIKSMKNVELVKRAEAHHIKN